MPTALLLIGTLALAATAPADAPNSPAPIYDGREKNIRVEVPRLDASVELDGRLSEDAWQQAAHLVGFSEYAPDDGRASANRTEVLVWYSATSIHFGIRAHAAAGSVRATLADRDHIDNDDWVLIFLSTFNDGRQASVFGVNPLGVQMDGAVVEGTGQGGHFGGGLSAGRPQPDLSPDFVFDSKGHLTDYGYEVEVKIPFKSLKYQSAAIQNWGMHVIRRVQSTGHEDSWVSARRSAASFLDQSGTLVGLHDIRRGLVMDLNPVITGRADGRGSPGGWSYDTHRPELGGNMRWGVTPNLTLNATVNPDFSQVESDATQFQVDPRQALFFAEKRPFFLDGIEFFSTPNNLVYSRRIVSPIVAAKLTGKVAGNTIAVATAVDDVAQSAGGGSHPVFNIARVQHDIGGSSRAALVYTDRLDGSTTNHVFGADTHLVWLRIYAADLQAAASRSADPDGSASGALWQAVFTRSGRRYGFRYAVNGNAPDFQAASGFIGRPGVVNGNLTNQLTLYGRQGALIEKWTGDVQLLGVWRYDDFLGRRGALERKFHTNANFFFRGGWHAGASVLVERFDYDAAIYSNYRLFDNGVLRPYVGTARLPNLDYVVSLDTPRVHGLSANVFYIWGKDENFFEWARARIVYGTLTLQWRPTERLRADFNYNLQTFARMTDDSYVGVARAPRLKLEYQAARSIFFRYVGEYASNYRDALRDDSRTDLPIVFLAADGTFTPAGQIRQRAFRNDWLFSYQPTPGTVLFAGYGNALTTPDAAVQRTVRRTRDGFFLKFSYLIRM